MRTVYDIQLEDARFFVEARWVGGVRLPRQQRWIICSRDTCFVGPAVFGDESPLQLGQRVAEWWEMRKAIGFL